MITTFAEVGNNSVGSSVEANGIKNGCKGGVIVSTLLLTDSSKIA